MPRCLVLDWDRDRCQVLAGNIARSGVRIDAGAVWQHPEITGTAAGEEAGPLLRDFLKNAGISSGPVLISLPKQRVLLKEIRCPAVSADEEPAIVRFQAAKELLENPDEIVLDYSHISKSSRDNQILLASTRKEVLAGFQGLCKAAGLKLLGVTPRPFVLADLLARSLKLDPSSGPQPEWSAVLLLGDGWAELTILHGQAVCVARSLPCEDLSAEVRRSLAMFATQPQGHPVQTLYLFGKKVDAPLAEQLKQTLSINVVIPRLLADSDSVDPEVDCPAGVGLLAAWTREQLAVNFVRPKEPTPPAPSNTRLWVLLGAAGVVMMMGFMFFSKLTLDNMRQEIAQAKVDKEKIKQQLDSMELDRLEIDGLEEFENGSIAWADELYELAARFPFDAPGFHLNRAQAELKPRRGKELEKLPSRLTLTGVEPSNEMVRQQFVDRLNAQLIGASANPGARADNFARKDDSPNRFTIAVDLARQPASSFLARLEVPEYFRAQKPRRAP